MGAAGKEISKTEVGKETRKASKAGEGAWVKTQQYFRSVWAEVKKVHWPTRNESIVYTGVVFLTVIIVGLIIWLFDSFLSFFLNLLLK
ncbi:preprotein translocase subunit SecE [Carboxydothermus ferrireducens]|uniref:Protein translocase subunit SecE n=1 Tax=Carboxydothermus ferrireducens DSM 11255 TaxID=1119529 RepID=A0ABX2RCY4_9THEO|nr:preprotein translocase subunit SecE [Carboxydothermus ferrireducens]NYE57928.1 preprotein translocase subunit SecE [Carboxydothermus ferrireducens DSM 11255]